VGAGPTPRENSSAGKRRESGVLATSDCASSLLGASTVMRNARSRSDRATQWQRGILARRRIKVAVLAQAAKTARIAWAILTSPDDGLGEAALARMKLPLFKDFGNAKSSS
jgi:transposase